MNDIKLVKDDSGYDWSFKNNDIENVIGDQQLSSAIMHKILLKKGELTQVNYQDTGSSLHNYINSPHTTSNINVIKSEIENQCREVPGIFDAKVDLTINENSIEINSIYITKENGGEFKIGI